MALVIDELVVQTKLVDESVGLDKDEIYRMLDSLRAENIKLKKDLAILKEKLDSVIN